ncbi:hypothetical protein BpHYR1_001203 [Brachionus plicatilis]|uniref:Uncharacterized protein n=1 Tax=Brachionus plicatilis TaxID=10195 RepID=A0A3M7PBI3_BRAPC|nr:hypothetical protein BpHYR1_001203 [Brachionus plicatilis]
MDKSPLDLNEMKYNLQSFCRAKNLFVQILQYCTYCFHIASYPLKNSFNNVSIFWLGDLITVFYEKLPIILM